MSKTLKYTLSIEFPWDQENGFSKRGVPKISFWINPNRERDFDAVGVEILNALFLSCDKLRDISSLNKVIEEILNVTQGIKKHFFIGYEAESLEIKKDLSRVIDGLDMYGKFPVDGQNSWNISTPSNLQYIPTIEILEIFRNWKNFLIVSERITLTNEPS